MIGHAVALVVALGVPSLYLALGIALLPALDASLRRTIARRGWHSTDVVPVTPPVLAHGAEGFRPWREGAAA